MLVMLCRIFKRCSDAVRIPCTHIQPKSWSSPPASEECLQLKGDKLSWQPCQALWKTWKTTSTLYLPHRRSSCLPSTAVEGHLFAWGRRIGGSDMGLQPTSLVLHLGHFQTWSLLRSTLKTDGFVSLTCLSGPDVAGGRWGKELFS